MITHPAPDHVYRGTAYRLAEPGRSDGASVRYCDVGTCSVCQKALPLAGKCVRLADRVVWLHITCAIRRGVLVPA